MKLSKVQLRKLIREAVDVLVARQAQDILRHYDVIASDMGRTMGLDPASIREVFKGSCAHVVDSHFPENRR